MRSMLLLMLAGCGSRSFGICDADGRCAEFTYHDELWRLDLAEDFCEGTWSWDGACATDDAVGTCTFDGDYATSVYTYSSPEFDAATAEANCADIVRGTFEP